MVQFSWTERKRRQVLAERGVDFILVTGIFDGRTIIEEDRRRDYGEKRYVAIGESEGEYYTVVYTPRKSPQTGEDVIHLITAWRSGRKSRRRHQELFD
jgi:uncharacterized DUF497 family protein